MARRRLFIFPDNPKILGRWRVRGGRGASVENQPQGAAEVTPEPPVQSLYSKVLAIPNLKALYDPSDLTSMFQSRFGTGAAAAGQPVGVMLDKSQMGEQTAAAFLASLATPQLVTNGGFNTDTTGWAGNASATIAWAAGVCQVTIAAASSSGLTSSGNVSVTAGKAYLVKARVRKTTYAGSSVILQLQGISAPAQTITGTFQTLQAIIFSSTTAVNTTVRIIRGEAQTGVIEVDDVSVQEIPGFHAQAPADASRPTLRRDVLDPVAAVASAPELLANPTFDANITGWSALNNGVVEWDASGRMKITAPANQYGGVYSSANLYASLPHGVDQYIVLQASYDAASRMGLTFGDNAGNNFGAGGLGPTGPGVYSLTVVQQNFTDYNPTHVQIVFQPGAPGDVTYVDNVSVKVIPENAPWRYFLQPDGADDWMTVPFALNLGLAWYHVGAWRPTGAGRPFALNSTGATGIRATAAPIAFQARNDANSADLSLGTTADADAVLTVERASDAAIAGRVNKVAGAGGDPFNNAGTAGLALFSDINTAWTVGFAGRFYGGMFGTGALAAGDRDNGEALFALRAGITFP